MIPLTFALQHFLLAGIFINKKTVTVRKVLCRHYLTENIKIQYFDFRKMENQIFYIVFCMRLYMLTLF